MLSQFEFVLFNNFVEMELPVGVEIFQEEYSVEKAARYEILGKLGEGTFGEVKKALDVVTGKHVAIKYVRILSRKSGIPKAVFRELQSLKQLSDSEYIIKLLDVYTDESNLCLVMECIVSDLSEVISQSKSYLSRAHLKCIFKMMFAGLAHCHSRNVIHRDIKPSSELMFSISLAFAVF